MTTDYRTQELVEGDVVLVGRGNAQAHSRRTVAHISWLPDEAMYRVEFTDGTADRSHRRDFGRWRTRDRVRLHLRPGSTR